MHKFCLTEPECERIQGAQKIIETLGYFPSMENTILEEVNIKNTHRLAERYEVCLVFFFFFCGKHTVPGGKPKLQLTFYGVREVYMNTDGLDWRFSPEIKFTNSIDRTKVYRDDLPSTTPIIPRPFTGFAIGRGQDFFLEFFDEEITVDAFLID